MVTLGVCGEVIICLCFLFFNARNSTFITNEDFNEGNGAVRTILVSFISGASASIMIFATRPIINFIGKVDEISIYDPITLLGCFMAGLISIGSSCQNVALESALIIGPIGTILFMLSKKILLKMEIDDALN
jgi:ammonia channel protein AmtB